MQTPSPPYSKEVLVKDANIAEIRTRYPNYPEVSPEPINEIMKKKRMPDHDMTSQAATSNQMVSGDNNNDFKTVVNKRKRNENAKMDIIDNNTSKMPKI